MGRERVSSPSRCFLLDPIQLSVSPIPHTHAHTHLSCNCRQVTRAGLPFISPKQQVYTHTHTHRNTQYKHAHKDTPQERYVKLITHAGQRGERGCVNRISCFCDTACSLSSPFLSSPPSPWLSPPLCNFSPPPPRFYSPPFTPSPPTPPPPTALPRPSAVCVFGSRPPNPSSIQTSELLTCSPGGVVLSWAWGRPEWAWTSGALACMLSQGPVALLYLPVHTPRTNTHTDSV